MSKPRVLGYARLSRDSLVSTSIARQHEMLAAHCLAHDFELAHVVVDVDVSGARSPFDRPELATWLGGDPPQPWDGLVSWRLDRISRSASDAWALYTHLDKQGRFLQTVTDGVDSRSPTGKLMLGILAAVAEAERTTTRERIIASQRYRQSHGLHITGTAPFGYRLEQTANGKRRVPDPVTAPLVVEAVDRVIAGATLTEVAAWLNAEGATTVTGGPWRGSTLGRYLRSEVPLGHGHQHQKGHPRGEVHHQGGEAVKFGDSLLTVGKWQALQVALTNPPRREPDKHISLRGIVECAVCSALMRATGRQDRRRYVCPTEGHSNSIVAAPVDAWAGAAFYDYLVSTGVSSAFVTGTATNADVPPELIDEREESLRALSRLGSALATGEYKDAMLDVFRQQVAVWEARLDKAEKLIANVGSGPEDFIEEAGVSYIDVYNEMDREEKRLAKVRAGMVVIIDPPAGRGSREGLSRVRAGIRSGGTVQWWSSE